MNSDQELNPVGRATQPIAFHRIAGLLLLASVLPAAATSFDCSKAIKDYEKVVCADKRLSALDDKLAAIYRDLLDAPVDTSLIRIGQRDWTASRSDCRSNANPQTCLADMYSVRIDELARIVDGVRKPAVAAKHFDLANISQHYAFTVRPLTPCAGANECTGPAIVQIMRLDSGKILQTIVAPNIVMHVPDGKQPLANSNAMYDYGGVINLADYNLDGKPDLALQTGNLGPYAQPSYDIFLNEVGGGFKHSSAFTNLSRESLDSISIEGNQMVVTSKSGCCIHYKSWYDVANNRPVPSRQLTFDSASDEKYDLTITDAWKNGKWHRVAVKKDRKSDYCEETLWQAVGSLYQAASQDAKFSCRLMPDNQKQGILATSIKKGKTDSLLVILGRINDGTLLASYIRSQSFGGRISEVRLHDNSIALAPGIAGIEVMVFFEQDGRTYGVTTVLRKDGNKLVPVVENLLTNFSQGGATRLRYFTKVEPVVEGWAKLNVRESIQESGHQQPTVRDVSLAFEGTRYIVPPGMQYKP
ncbi:MAG: lysozyme inhibitor LprI family protein [Thiobacillus sp.]|nr:lysozyme inhibitor LprI family protein [Sulfuritalea sp.]MDP1928138.1 lysozyme inhibitor LprI family protein [Thiobacillus sp.]